MRQRKLSQDELEVLWKVVPKDTWSEGKLQLIWNQRIPEDATIEDFNYFIYFCDQKRLDPLLNEAYLRLQFSKSTGKKEPVIIASISSMLKAAQLSKVFDGITTDFSYDNDGSLFSATTRIWKSNCSHTFDSTVYFREYAELGRDDGKPKFMWASKPHIMLSKCSVAAALRLAFSAELSGTYVEEEFQQRSEPEHEKFVVEATPKEVPHGTSDVRREPKLIKPAPVVDQPTAEPVPTKVVDAPVAVTLKDQLAANRQRLANDLSIPQASRKGAFEGLFLGWFGIDNPKLLPKSLEGYSLAMTLLDEAALENKDPVREALLYTPRDLGKTLKEVHDSLLPDFKELSVLAYKVSTRFKFELEELKQYLRVNNILLVQPDDVKSFFRLALYDRQLAADVASSADQTRIGIAFILEAMEKSLGAPIENFSLDAVRATISPAPTRVQ